MITSTRQFKNDFETYIARVDAKLNESGSQSLFVRFNAQDDIINDPEQYEGTGPRYSDTYKNWGMAVGHAWVISNNWMNTFRYGYTKIDYESQGLAEDDYVDFRFIDDIIPRTYSQARTTPATDTAAVSAQAPGTGTTR